MKNYRLVANGTHIYLRGTGPCDALHNYFNFLNIDPRGILVTMHGDFLSLNCHSNPRAAMIFGKYAEFIYSRVEEAVLVEL